MIFSILRKSACNQGAVLIQVDCCSLNCTKGAAPYSQRCTVPHTKNRCASVAIKSRFSFLPVLERQLGQGEFSSMPICRASMRKPWSRKQSEQSAISFNFSPMFLRTFAALTFDERTYYLISHPWLCLEIGRTLVISNESAPVARSEFESERVALGQSYARAQA